MQIFKKKSYFIFLIKIIAILLICFLASAGCSFITDSVLNDGFLYAYKDKLNTLKSIEGEKTVFVGGSSVLFGVSAEHYEQLSGKKAVNMGLNAGTYDVYLETIKPHINKGDTVIFAFEFDGYTDEWYNFTNITLDLAHISKNYFQTLPFKYKSTYLYKQTLRHYEKTFSVISKFIKRILKDDEFYTRAIVNQYGDIKPELFKTKADLPDPTKIKKELNYDSLAEILKHIEELETKGAKVFILYPPCYISEDNGSMDEMDNKLKSYFGNRVLGNMDDWLFETDENFFDTVYHLNHVATIKHTHYYYDLIRNAK